MTDHCPPLPRATATAPRSASGGGAAQVDALDAWLPQTQCTQCGFPHCRAYAEALAIGSADINQCPPGGETTIAGLAALLHTATKALDARFGGNWSRRFARIDESRCIGCTLCIQTCPVDTIVGAGKLMHTVIRQECTGCRLCLPPCPVDCIDLVPAPRPVPGNDWRWPDYSPAETARARQRLQARLRRLAARAAGREARRKNLALRQDPSGESLRQEIRAAVARVRARRPGRRFRGA